MIDIIVMSPPYTDKTPWRDKEVLLKALYKIRPKSAYNQKSLLLGDYVLTDGNIGMLKYA